MKLLKEGRMKKFIRKHKHEIGKGLTFFSEKELKDTQTAEILCTS